MISSGTSVFSTGVLVSSAGPPRKNMAAFFRVPGVSSSLSRSLPLALRRLLALAFLRLLPVARSESLAFLRSLSVAAAAFSFRLEAEALLANPSP